MRVVFLGDSITAGYPTMCGWRAYVCEALRGTSCEVVGLFEDRAKLQHCGFHGHPLASLYEQIPKVLELRPDVVVLQAGGNALPDGSPKDIETYAQAILRTLLANGVKQVFICTLTDVAGYSETIADYNAALRDACEASKPGCQILEVGHHLGVATATNPLFADEAHPSSLGYRKLGELIGRGAFGVDTTAMPKSVIASPTAHFGAAPSVFQQASDAILSAYPAMTPSVRQAALGIGWTETGFGQSGTWAPDGVPSNNWGGLTYSAGRCPKFIEHGDHDAAGNPVTYRFCAFPTLRDGAVAWYEVWAKPDTLDAAKKGDAWGIALAMKRHGYYTGTQGDEYDRVLAYARMLMAGATAAATNLGEKLALYLSPPPKAIVSSSPVSFANLGVLALSLGIFVGTLKMKVRQ